MAVPSQYAASLVDTGILESPDKTTHLKEATETRVPLEEHLENLKIAAVQNPELSTILNRNHTAFARDDKDIGLLKFGNFEIKTTDNDPAYVPPYRVPHSRALTIDKEINRLLEAGVISPSTSAYSAPCLIVLKKMASPGLLLITEN